MLTAAEKRKSVSWNSYRRASCTGVFSRSVMSDSAAPWTVDCQNPLPVKFSRQEYWSGVPFPTPEDLPNPGIYPSTAPPALASGFFTTSTTGKPSVLGRVAFSKPGQTEEQVHGSVPGWYNQGARGLPVTKSSCSIVTLKLLPSSPIVQRGWLG